MGMPYNPLPVEVIAKNLGEKLHLIVLDSTFAPTYDPTSIFALEFALFTAEIISGRILAKISSGRASSSRPKSLAVVSFKNVALFSGVPSCVGWSARTMSKVFASPSTGVSFTLPGYKDTLSCILFSSHTSPAYSSPEKYHDFVILLMRKSRSTKICSMLLARI